jgi:hypothetical protein
MKNTNYTAGRAIHKTRKLSSGWVEWRLVTNFGEDLKISSRERSKTAANKAAIRARDEYNKRLKESQK